MPVKKSTTPKTETPKAKKAPAKTAKSSSLKIKKFELPAPHAKSVYLAGQFNDWSTSANPLKLDAKTGLWKASVKLAPGRYLYKFIVDGEWWSDPGNPDWEWNCYGSHDSIISVK
jgi:1,4-alpha-glucan branching enzyme